MTRKKTTRRKATNKKDWALQIVRHVWPQERDFLERPERYRYVRKLLPEASECVFCAAAKAGVGLESLVLAQDEHAMVVMNKFPYNTGHLLVLPRQHLGDFSGLEGRVMHSLSRWLQVSTGILKDELKCQGFNIGLNLGAVAGAGIPDHLHWHIVPRWGGDTNFFPLIAETKVIPETVLQTYERLIPHFVKASAK